MPDHENVTRLRPVAAPLAAHLPIQENQPASTWNQTTRATAADRLDAHPAVLAARDAEPPMTEKEEEDEFVHALSQHITVGALGHNLGRAATGIPADPPRSG